MKLPLDPRLPTSFNDNIRPLVQRLYELFREYSKAFNDSYMWDTLGTSYPTTGTWSQGDKCKNTSPTELGSSGSKYLIIGWCFDGTNWLQMRVLTGG